MRDPWRVIDMPLDLQSFVRSACDTLAELAGVVLFETLSFRAGNITAVDDTSHNSFFGTFGAWDAEGKQVVVNIERCSEERSPPHVRNGLIKVVAVHFCASAVVHLGINPKTGKTYVGWDDPRQRFAAEAPPFRPLIALHAALERQRTLFTQILTYVYVLSRHSPVMLEPFAKLSRGRFGLYDLDYTKSPFTPLVDPHLRRDWKGEAEADWKSTAAVMALVLGWLTPEAPVSRDDSVMYPFDE